MDQQTRHQQNNHLTCCLSNIYVLIPTTRQDGIWIAIFVYKIIGREFQICNMIFYVYKGPGYGSLDFGMHIHSG